MKKTLLNAILSATIILTPVASVAAYAGDYTAPTQYAGLFDFGGNQSKFHPILAKYWDMDQYGNVKGYVKTAKLSELTSKCLDKWSNPLVCDVTAEKAVFETLDADTITMAKDFLTIQDSKLVIGQTGNTPKYTGWAISLLGIIRDKTNVKLLTDLIDTDEKCTDLVCAQKEDILRALWRIGDKTTIPAILTAMGNTKCINSHKKWAAYYLGLWGTKDATDVCKKAFKDEQDNDVMAACMLYLAMIKDTSAIPHMLRLIETNEVSVVKALAVMKDKSAVEKLKEILAKYKPVQYTYRIPILTALAACGDAGAYKELNTYLTNPKGNNSEKEEAANWGVLLKGTPFEAQVKKGLSDVLKGVKGNDYDAQRFKIALNSALAILGDKNGLNAVLKELNNTKDDIKEIALKTLGGDDNYPYNKYNGFGILGLADTSLIPKLKEFYELERNTSLQQMALTAALEINARAEAQKK